jgi:hypothetical protein
MIYLGGYSIIHDGEVIRKSAPGDDKRFYSTVEERVNGIWDDNDWCAPGAPGESSFITSKFIHIGGLECLVTTNNGVYWVGLEPGVNGLPRVNILPVLVGAGCPTGACCMKWGTFYFLSNIEKIAGLKAISNAELIREAIDYKVLLEFGNSTKTDIIKTTRGLLKQRLENDMSSEKIVEKMRTEWEQRDEGNNK